jgi:hypothetical protein
MKAKQVNEGKYKIKISYSTGDSLHNYDTEDTLEISWNDLNVAKQNLKFIKEHYDMYENITGWNKKTKEECYEQNKDKEWFVYEKILLYNECKIDEKDKHKYDKTKLRYAPDDFLAQHCIKLKTDDENIFQMLCFWTGYFEQLKEAEIVMDEDEDMKFTIN